MGKKLKNCIADNRDWLENQYIVLGKSISGIAKEVGVSRSAIEDRLALFGIPKRESLKEKHKRLLGLKKLIIKLYKNKDLTTREIANKLGVEKTAIADLLRREGVLKTSKEKLSGRYVGEKASNWKGGVTKKNIILRYRIEQRCWVKSVLERDNFTCQKCGQRGGNLEVHHIFNFADYPELRLAIDNGVTLCKKCHKEFHKRYGYKNNTKEQFEEFMCN